MFKTGCVFVAALVGALFVNAGVSQTAPSSSFAIKSWNVAAVTSPNGPGSSSASDSDAEVGAAPIVAVPQPLAPKPQSDDDRRILPFSRIAFGTKTGTLGLGGQIATPLTRWLNLRGGFDLFNFGYSLTNSGTNYYSALHMESGEVSADFYPFHRSSFHVSPGLLIFKSRLSASMLVPGGNTFSENDVDYTSDPSDPVTGSGTAHFGRTVMPAFTMGFGNMIKRREHSHWSVPVEVGAAYTGQNTVNFGFAGSVCDSDGCGSVNDPSVAQNVNAEQNKINEEIKRFKIYPILTTGVSYRF
jgi:hypothetical protein